MPPGFWLANWPWKIWIPYFFRPEEKVNGKGGGWNLVARLRPGVSFDQAQNEVARPQRQENKGAGCSSPEPGAHSR